MPHKYFTIPDSGYADPETGRVLIEDALREARENVNRPYPWTAPILRQMIQRDQHVSYTPTKLMGCDRSLLLKMEEDYSVDPKSMWARMRGTMLHAVFEDTEAGEYAEVGLIRPIKVDGKWRAVVGRADLIEDHQSLVLGFQDLTDYKTVGRWYGDYPKAEHIALLKLYKWMGQAHGLDLARGQLVYINVAYGEIKREVVDPIPDPSEDWIERRVRDLVAIYDDGWIPPVINEKKAWMCKNCDVLRECREWARAQGITPPGQKEI